MKTEKPDWMKRKELHDSELIKTGGQGREDGPERPRSFGAVYGPSESLVDQTADGLIDVSQLMARFEKTGKLEELIAAGVGSPNGGFYGDFIGAPDYETALQISNKAKEQFNLLSAPLRARFDHDPGKFLAFVNDPKNGDELITMGLRKPAAPQPEPDLTNRDVVNAIKEANAARKTAGKGGKREDD